MPFSITIAKQIFQIKWTGTITESSIMDCSKELSVQSDYPEKNRIYDLREATVEVSGFRLSEIANFTQMMYPKNAPDSKTAIVVSPGFQKSIAEAFKEFEKNLPYQIKIFLDAESAKKWALE